MADHELVLSSNELLITWFPKVQNQAAAVAAAAVVSRTIRRWPPLHTSQSRQGVALAFQRPSVPQRKRWAVTQCLSGRCFQRAMAR